MHQTNLISSKKKFNLKLICKKLLRCLYKYANQFYSFMNIVIINLPGQNTADTADEDTRNKSETDPDRLQLQFSKRS